MSFYKIKNSCVLVSVYILPRSSKTEIVGLYGDALKIKLKSPPVDNAANEELIRFLTEKLKISKSNIDIVSGHTKKRKILALFGCNVKLMKGIL